MRSAKIEQARGTSDVLEPRRRKVVGVRDLVDRSQDVRESNSGSRRTERVRGVADSSSDVKDR